MLYICWMSWRLILHLLLLLHEHWLVLWLWHSLLLQYYIFIGSWFDLSAAWNLMSALTFRERRHATSSVVKGLFHVIGLLRGLFCLLLKLSSFIVSHILIGIMVMRFLGSLVHRTMKILIWILVMIAWSLPHFYLFKSIF